LIEKNSKEKINIREILDNPNLQITELSKSKIKFIFNHKPYEFFKAELDKSFEFLTEQEFLKSQILEQSGSQNKNLEIHSPMPGKVVKILKQIGDKVKAGEGIIVVEAMKMENELKAKQDCEVKEILVSTGQTVESKALLVQLFIG